MAQAREHSAVIMGMKVLVFHRMGGRELPARFASCPPAFGLRLDLRKARRQPALPVSGLLGLYKTPFAAMGMVCLPQRSNGGARRAGDMSGGGYAVPVAGSKARNALGSQIKIDRK